MSYTAALQGLVNLATGAARAGHAQFGLDLADGRAGEGTDSAIRFADIVAAGDQQALQIAALRQRAGLSQKELAQRVKTSQQQICRLESPGYEGHSLSMLRRVARELSARVHVVIEPEEVAAATGVAETLALYRTKRARSSRSGRAKNPRD